MKWVVIEKGINSLTASKKEKLNEEYGRGNWMVCWETPHSLMAQKAAYRYLFERSYYEYFMANPNLIKELGSYSRLDSITSRRLSTIISKAFELAGGSFSGAPISVLYIEKTDPVFGTRKVPFFVPKWIDQSVNTVCRKDNSLEHFWQANKRVAAKQQDKK